MYGKYIAGRVLLCFFLPGLLPFSVSAADSPVLNIRRLYRESFSRDLHENMIICNTTLAAVGLQSTKITFFHQPSQVNPERDPYQMQYRLFRVVVTYNIAASVRYRTEYLFDENRRCVFCYRKKEVQSEPAETLRLYFMSGKLFMILKEKGGKRTMRSAYLTSSDLKSGLRAQQEAGIYLKAFRNTLALEKAGK